MKKLEDIEVMYKEYIPKLPTTKREELEAYIDFTLSEIEENKFRIQEDFDGNLFAKFFAKMRNFFLIFHEAEDVTFYDKDNELLEEVYIFNSIYEDFFKIIRLNISDSNLKDLSKLSEFLVICYGESTGYIDSRRDSLEYSYKGFSCINNRYEDNIEAVFTFFTEYMRNITERKRMEKIMKI